MGAFKYLLGVILSSLFVAGCSPSSDTRDRAGMESDDVQHLLDVGMTGSAPWRHPTKKSEQTAFWTVTPDADQEKLGTQMIADFRKRIRDDLFVVYFTGGMRPVNQDTMITVFIRGLKDDELPNVGIRIAPPASVSRNVVDEVKRKGAQIQSTDGEPAGADNSGASPLRV